MKILHIITSLGPGGAEGMLYRLIKSSSNYVEHSVICLNKGGKYVSLMREANIDVLVLNLSFSSSYRGIIPLVKFALFKKKQGYGVITSWLYHADLVSWFVRLICRFDSLIWNIRYTKLQLGRPSLKNWLILKTLSKLSNYKVDKIISCSESACKVHKNLGYNKEIFKVIPNGYFINKNQKFDIDLKNYDGIFRVCIIARWHHQKDFETLFQALDLLKYNNIHFHLTIAGSKTSLDNHELVALLNKYKLNDHCSLLGEVNNVHEIYRKSHVNVLCSAYGEAFPNVLAESMLNFTPCISTDVGDSNVILANVGKIIPIGDYKALTNALIEKYLILRDKNDIYIKDCIMGFKETCKRYNIKYVNRDYINVWKNLG